MGSKRIKVDKKARKFRRSIQSAVAVRKTFDYIMLEFHVSLKEGIPYSRHKVD